MGYIWQNKDWTAFYYDPKIIDTYISNYQQKKNSVQTVFGLLSPDIRKNIHADFVAQDAISTSKLEGVDISYDSVYSSIANALNIDFKSKVKGDKNSENLAYLMLEALDKNTVLNEELILKWHVRLFSGMAPKLRPSEVGCYRKEPVYVIKYHGNMREEIIYEGIPQEKIQEEMDKFFVFLKNTEIDDIIKSTIASFYFVTIHPFEDGNGRLSRLIVDNLLTSYDESYRIFSISTAILANKKSYYDELYNVQHSENLDVTNYIKWYISMLIEALDNAEKVCENKIRLSQFIMTLDPNEFNSREIMMLYKLASGSFVGKLTAEKWTKLMKCKPLTSSRDLAHLVEKKMLIKNDIKGSKTSYILNPVILREI